MEVPRVRRVRRSVAWQRAAGWAVVFLGAWWQVLGGPAASFAATEILPTAKQVYVEARQQAVREAAEGNGLVGAADRLAGGLTSLGGRVHRAVFPPGLPESR